LAEEHTSRREREKKFRQLKRKEEGKKEENLSKKLKKNPALLMEVQDSLAKKGGDDLGISSKDSGNDGRKREGKAPSNL